MKKRLFFLFLILCMLPMTVTAFATETDREPDQCGESMTWSFQDGILTVTGEGDMDDFPETAPWHAHRKEITHVLLRGNIRYIGANAFRDYDALQYIDFGSDLYEIGSYAFASCDNLTVIYLPASFKVFGESCLRDCENLTEIYSEGRFPTFRLNSLWDTYATIYYPADRPWGKQYIDQLEEAFQYRIRFLASDGTDPYTPTEPTTEPTTAPETTVPTTAPETTAPTTVPTLAPTLPSENPSTTAPATPTPGEDLPPDGTSSGNDGLLLWLTVFSLGLTVLILGALIFKGTRVKGKYAAKRRRSSQRRRS